MARNKQQGKGSKKTNSSSKGRFSQERNTTKKRGEVREAREVFLIVCQGEKTEPNYFENFPLRPDEIDVKSFSINPINLVKKAIDIRKEEGEYDQVWCVFDRDDWEANDFNGAITSAEKNGIKVAYSNEAFELWYLLHFYYRHTAMSRKNYERELTKQLRKAKLISKNQKYEKNSLEMYGFLEEKQGLAIQNAKRLLEQYDPPNPYQDNPSTTVHLLVEQLNRFVKGN